MLRFPVPRRVSIILNWMRTRNVCPVQTGSKQLTNRNCDIVFGHVGFAYQDGETVLKDVSFTAK